MTANLRGPLLMNRQTKLCKQLVHSGEFPTRHRCLQPPHPTRRNTSRRLSRSSSWSLLIEVSCLRVRCDVRRDADNLCCRRRLWHDVESD